MTAKALNLPPKAVGQLAFGAAAAALVAWGGYRAATYGVGARWPRREAAKRTPESIADISAFVPGAPPVPCELWDIGTGVAGYVWHAPQPRAVMLIQHGWADYAHRYVNGCDRLIPRLLARGVTVYALDMWGCGYSQGPRGAVDVARAINDHMIGRAKLAAGGLPVFAAGHSLGGLVTISSALRRQEGLDGVILLAPALRYEVSAAVRLMAGLVGFLVPTLASPLPAGSLDDLTADAAAATRLMNDTVVYRGRIPWVTAGGGATITHANWKRYGSLRTPLLAIHGELDRTTDPEASRELVRLAGSADKTLVMIPEARHALLDDVRREEATSAVLSWLEARLPALAAAA